MATENRLIDAHDLWSDIMMLPHNGDMISSEEVEQAIKDAPTVDAVDVVHGRWEPSEAMILSAKCSECKCWVTKHSIDEPDFRYCPNCGAKMDGEETDNEGNGCN